MCGLFGGMTLGLLSETEKNNIRQLGHMCQLRGTDSTGLVAISKKKNKTKYEIIKKVMPASEFLRDDDVREVMSERGVFAIAGHTRLATCGEINETNAHPIEVGRIIGLHNGVIWHFQPHEKDKDHRTDSRGLIERIDRSGIKEAIREVGTGAYALVYIDKEKGTINFVRNYQRPLWFMWNLDETTAYWASEPGMLRWLKERVGEGSFREPKIFTVEQHYEVSLKTMDIKTVDISPHISHIVQHRPAPSAQTTVTTTVPNVVKKLETPNTANIAFCKNCKRLDKYCSCKPIITGKGSFYWGWEKKAFKVEQVIDVLRYGCSSCSVRQNAYSDVMWVSPHKIVCSSCLKDRSIYQYIQASCDRMYHGSLIQGSHASNYGTTH